VDQGSPCLGTHEPTWGTNEPCLKLYEIVGPLLQGLYAPFLELKIKLTKLQAANWNTLTFWVAGLPPFCRTLQSYNSPGDWAKELSRPCTDSASLVVKIKKKRFSFSVGGFLKVTSQIRHVLKILATFGRPWAPTYWPILLAQSFVENKVKIRVYKALDWLANIFVAKIMGRKPSFWPNSKLFRKGIICPFRANFGQP